jgi:threonine synthase
MIFYSTNDRSHRVGFAQAVSKGLAPDGGLYMPESIPMLPGEWFEGLASRSFVDIGVDIARGFVKDVFDDAELRELVADVLQFDAPLVQIADDLAILELFHGPTLAFKDFGARFMARVFARINKGKEITILAATSGDTGSAVAHGFLDVPGIRVVLLYPSGKISRVQEMQMATIGRNVTALEVEGTFDDCQALVKRAFNDSELNSRVALSSANSINIARLIPQSFYYARALAQVSSGADPVFVVPSGNFGNLTAGLFLKRMGASAAQFMAATNANHVVPDYLAGDAFRPGPSVATLSNAMDVGNPSNFARMLALYGDDRDLMRRDVGSGWASDAQTLSTMREVYDQTGYVLDPHAAVGVSVWRRSQGAGPAERMGIVLGTAHPAKFGEVVQKALGIDVALPSNLAACLDKEKLSVKVDSRYASLVALLQH